MVALLLVSLVPDVFFYCSSHPHQQVHLTDWSAFLQLKPSSFSGWFPHQSYCCCIFFQEATEGRGVDVIVEMLSNVNLGKDLKMLAHGGCVTVGQTSQTRFEPLHSASLCVLHWLRACFLPPLQVVGSRGSVEIDPRQIMLKESSVVGVALFSSTPVWNSGSILSSTMCLVRVARWCKKVFTHPSK